MWDNNMKGKKRRAFSYPAEGEFSPLPRLIAGRRIAEPQTRTHHFAEVAMPRCTARRGLGKSPAGTASSSRTINNLAFTVRLRLWGFSPFWNTGIC